jgi:hypothetical protein
MTVTIREQELSAIMDALAQFVDNYEDALELRDDKTEPPDLRHARAVLARVEEAFTRTVGTYDD